MPILTRATPQRELERLIKLYLKAETDIINELGRLRSEGLVDYHAQAALERVQAILRQLESDSWTYVPKMIESNFYVRHPEARAIAEPIAKHVAGYANAEALTATQTNIVERLVNNLMGQLIDGNMTVMSNLQSALIGRVEPDIYRTVGLEQVAMQQATGSGVNKAVPEFLKALAREGVTAFTDKAGRNWSLHTYATMVSRTTARQAEILSVVSQDDEQDLYQITAHGSTCKLCAPYEGRVYSKSGKDPDFPPLLDAFGKIDPAGPDDLSNSWLNIHPNCLHSLRAWIPQSEAELEKMKRFSDPAQNPYSRDPRTEAQIKAYRSKENSRNKWLADYRQWEKYRTALGDEVPRTFSTFQKHKIAGDEKYQRWQAWYKASGQGNLLTNAAGNPIIKVKKPNVTGTPGTIVQITTAKGGITRNYYGSDGRQTKQISNNGHGHPSDEALGIHGEHAHDYSWDANGTVFHRSSRELTEQERKENRDIL